MLPDIIGKMHKGKQFIMQDNQNQEKHGFWTSFRIIEEKTLNNVRLCHDFTCPKQQKVPIRYI